jgi:glucosamine 6-phosphate synthetase-like amidotransferase/phosphosugar isomerase protein
MCGILALVWSNKPEALEIVKNSLKVLEKRGSDSWGMAYGDKGENQSIRITKAPRGVNSPESKKEIKQYLKDIPDVGWLLMHSRLATSGFSGLQNQNHPIISGNIAMVHNGLVTGTAPNMRPLNESITDSQHLANLINQCESGDTAHMLNGLQGEISVAWFSRKDQSVSLYTNVGNFHRFSSEGTFGYLSEPLGRFQIENRIEKRIVVKI